MRVVSVGLSVARLLGRIPGRIGVTAVVALAVMASVVVGARAEKEFNSQDIVNAVVGVTSMVPDDARSAQTLGTMRAGSGVVIDDKDLVLTIGYLILEAAAAAVTDVDGNLVPASLVAYDHNTGFGLLRATRPLRIKPLKLGSSDALAEGAPVIVVSKGGPVPVMPAQVVSRREFAGYCEYMLDKAIFTSPPHPQFGGAALIAIDGQLVGVGSLMVADAMTGEQPFPGNMFVPIDMLKPILRELINNGRTREPAHPWLGIYTAENAGRLFVTRVAKGGPAEAAGIKSGDVIMGVAGKRVSGMADFLHKVWGTGNAGVEVPIDMVPLDGGELTIKTIKVQSKDRYDWLKLSKGF